MPSRYEAEKNLFGVSDARRKQHEKGRAQYQRDNAEAHALRRQSSSAGTFRTYSNHRRHYLDYCQGAGVVPWPANPEVVAAYIQSQVRDGVSLATIRGRVAAGRYWERRAASGYWGFHDPLVDDVLRAVPRALRRPPRRVAPITLDQLRVLGRSRPKTLRKIRDKALLVLGFAAALRRSELVGLDVEDVVIGRDRLVIELRRSKTDQTGEGRLIVVPTGKHKGTCPKRLLERWLRVAGIERGPIFRTIGRWNEVRETRIGRRDVNAAVKRLAGRCNQEESKYAGHSLRRGWVTAARAAGVPSEEIIRVTGHRDPKMLRIYDSAGAAAAPIQVGL